jgi:hypothetical protein
MTSQHGAYLHAEEARLHARTHAHANAHAPCTHTHSSTHTETNIEYLLFFDIKNIFRERASILLYTYIASSCLVSSSLGAECSLS